MTETSTLSTQAAPDRLSWLVQRLEKQSDFTRVVDALRRGDHASLEGVWGSARALIAATLAQSAPGVLLVVCPKPEQADDLRDELPLFSHAPCRLLPAWETESGERIVYDEIYADRVRALKWLKQRPQAGVLVTSIQALMQPVPSDAEFAAQSRKLAVGDAVESEELRKWLVERGFHATTAVELSGEFASRGGIVDIFAPDWTHPVRVEFFGDQIDSLRQFDAITQRSIGNLSEVEISLLDPNSPGDVLLTDYLPAESWVALIEPQEIQSEAVQYHELLERPGLVRSYREVMKRIAPFATVGVEAMAASPAASTCRLPIESVERFSGEIGKVRGELDAHGAGHDVFIVCHNEAEAQRLGELFAQTKLATAGRLHFPLGRLREGFRFVPEKVVVVSGSELFQRTDLVRQARRHIGRPIESFLDLREGELVVHLAHGIGRYRGLELIERDHQVEEHLVLEFAERTKIYVPASRISLVQKYIGGTKSRPRLAKIGGRSWSRQKQAVQEAVTDMAVEMLELQARRASRPGIPFRNDSEWQQEFDALFPYHETPDQLAAIFAVKHDMTQPRPMDRLLCGDVGFGKTEVAMRAAFKAVDNGYQVAILVPTTVLAAQHLRTFHERMAEFPIEIAALSRFSTRRRQQETIERLADGTVEIVIGTHRLAQKDVQFANLGLVIIDEEQRFGVEIKERLKTYRESVDVLTMTATPIPRTLHMALVGARDISNLETAPEDRLSVETRVTRFDEALVRHAVLRELNRGGQIYYVHNRVKDIAAVAEKLRQVVPEARIGIGHGQMAEGELEKVMVEFVNHEFDLLLATTIVESGLDIPTANTIFIDDADRYGLADLHQLRGRVGRYKHRAYCYLLIDPKKHITPNAAKRLRAIEEYSEIGAGFAISMRDLEIRGAGNVLGTQQSGHIAAVGYELYCQLLEGAVRRLNHQPPKRSIDVDIDLPGEAYLPRAYIPDMRLKLDLYRRLCAVETYQELDQVEAEIVDRFGPLPPPAARMLALAGLRLDAARWAISSIRLHGHGVLLGLGDLQRGHTLERLTRRAVRVVDESTAYLSVGKGVSDPDRVLEAVKSVLQTA